MKFQYAGLSLNEAYDLTFKHALELIRRNGGRVAEDHVEVAPEPIKAVRVEQNFEGHFPIAEIPLRRRLSEEATFSFEGVGFVVQGSARSENSKDHAITVEMYIDNQMVETIELPTNFTSRRFTPFWRYGLPDRTHTVRLKIRNPSADASVSMDRVVIYGSKPRRPAV
jgi:hypothetical protein